MLVTVRKTLRMFTKLRRPVAYTFTALVVLVFTWGLLYFNLQKMEINHHKQDIKALVDVAYHSILPIVSRLESGEIDKRTALEEASSVVGNMTYYDDFGENSLFMRTLDGTVLAQPLDKKTEGTNEWNAVDAKGAYFVREQVEVATSNPEGGYVSYYYPVPGKGSIEEKVSYVRAIPELGIYIGTGLYMKSSFLSLSALLSFQRSGILITLSSVVVLSSVYVFQLARHIENLENEIVLRKNAEKELSKEKETLKITLESIGDGVLATDLDGKITLFNKASAKITGWSPEEALGRPCDEVLKLMNETTGNPVESPVKLVMRKGTVVGLANHSALLRRDGKIVSIADSAAPIRDTAGNTHGIVMVFRDVTEERNQQQVIEFLSYHDPLTGLYNRRFIEEQCETGSLKTMAPMCIVMGDLNGLKLVNDAFGHAEGDCLLKRAAEVINSVCKDCNLAARWGGDEFLLLCPGGNCDTAESVCEMIKRKCSTDNCTIPVSIALGCAVRTRPEENIWDKIKEAEERMYHAKLLESKSYRNNLVRTLSGVLVEKSLETMEHAERIRRNSLVIARSMNLTTRETEDLALLALLHDIGKVAMREDVLRKEGPLTIDEWEELKKHAEIGYRIAQTTPEISHIAEYILTHHEWWDGSGYPQGLKGTEIPLLSRILAVADAFDAMTAPRHYNSVMTKSEALEELKRCSGTQFDPEIVARFVELSDEMVCGDGGL